MGDSRTEVEIRICHLVTADIEMDAYMDTYANLRESQGSKGMAADQKR